MSLQDFAARNQAKTEALREALRLVLGVDLADELIATAGKGSPAQLATDIRQMIIRPESDGGLAE